MKENKKKNLAAKYWFLPFSFLSKLFIILRALILLFVSHIPIRLVKLQNNSSQIDCSKLKACSKLSNTDATVKEVDSSLIMLIIKENITGMSILTPLYITIVKYGFAA